ncbi:unnamed protein product [Brachionus calyciflorus]|uniref:DDE-1 domain-containing protein n=1 Tax=Brachionus calyciflorus TaxID=104777 RepID=A0A813R5I7_9BILA|nr:unnamed protein product [Brachionus calyciflorus]
MLHHMTEREFSNVSIKYLPPNTTSVLQLLDAGIINSFKCHYRKNLIKFFINATEIHGKIVLPEEALYMVRSSWDKVSKDCIRNCWNSDIDNLLFLRERLVEIINSNLTQLTLDNFFKN